MKRTRADVESDQRIEAIAQAIEDVKYTNYSTLAVALLSPGILPDSAKAKSEKKFMRQIRVALTEKATENEATPGEVFAALAVIFQRAGGRITRDELRERDAERDPS